MIIAGLESIESDKEDEEYQINLNKITNKFNDMFESIEEAESKKEMVFDKTNNKK